MNARSDICARKSRYSPESAAANERMAPRKKTWREIVLEAIAKRGSYGATCEEIAVQLGMRYTNASARFSELKRLGIIVRALDQHGNQMRRRTTGGDLAGVFCAVAHSEPEQLSFEVTA